MHFCSHTGKGFHVLHPHVRASFFHVYDACSATDASSLGLHPEPLHHRQWSVRVPVSAALAQDRHSIPDGGRFPRRWVREKMRGFVAEQKDVQGHLHCTKPFWSFSSADQWVRRRWLCSEHMLRTGSEVFLETNLWLSGWHS